MLFIIMSRSSLKLGHVGSKTRSLGQILEKKPVHSRGHSFDHKFLKLCQNDNDHNIPKNPVYILKGTVLIQKS